MNVPAKLRAARVGRLATTGKSGPAVLPICFVFDGERIYTAIDGKPKDVPPEKLARLRRIRENPEVALVVDEYSEDWSRLWYVLVRGRAELVSEEPERLRALGLLREKYSQYREGFLPDDAPVIRILVERVTSWGG